MSFLVSMHLSMMNIEKTEVLLKSCVWPHVYFIIYLILYIHALNFLIYIKFNDCYDTYYTEFELSVKRESACRDSFYNIRWMPFKLYTSKPEIFG